MRRLVGVLREPDGPGPSWEPSPGLGQVDWRRLIDALYDGGFDGVLSVEHEDPVWGGTEERIKTGLRVAHRTLRPLIVA